jgi:predicted metal-dependent phosphoesterase TrpH
MDFVTITDHDTIDGCLELSDRDDCFMSEELTAWFAGEPQAVHVLCYGITVEDHDFLQANARDLEVCAEYLHSNRITCALAHPFFAVAAPLTASHRRRLAGLFPVWETRNGSRARELNMPAAVYIETHGGTGIGGSDDHAGVDIGRTFTETPPASSPEEFLRHVREGRAESRGDQGSAAKWAHSALVLASRALNNHPATSSASPAGVPGLAGVPFSPSAQKRTIAPEEPRSEATIGNALASISCFWPPAAMIVKVACAGRPMRIASVVFRASTSIGLPSTSKGPNAFVHSSASMRPFSSNERPSSAEAASL